MIDYFIDYLTVSQLYDYEIPKYSSTIITKTNSETGELILQTSTFKTHKGSFETSINIKSDGTRLTVSGNPSRFNRRDNLFGYTCIDECFRVFNDLLQSLGLPLFTKSTYLKSVFSNKSKKYRQISDGARVSSIHLTKNFCVGFGNERRFIRSLGSLAYRGKLGFIYPNGDTIDWLSGSRRMYIKFYNKSASLIKERKKLVQSYSNDDIKYYDDVIDFCEKNGVVRLEYEFKSNLLTEKNLCYWGYANFHTLIDDNFLENRFKKMKCNAQDYDCIADMLIESGIVNSRQAANATQNYYQLWLHGHDLTLKLKKSQFYTHKSRLLGLGIDITEVVNIQTFPLRLVSNRDITLVDCVIPDFYVVAA